MEERPMTSQQSKALGEMVRAARHERGLSTRQLGEIVGVNQSQLVRLEQGKTLEPQPSLLQSLSEALDLRLVDIYELAGIRMPSLQPYLRATYGLNPKDTAKAEAYIQRLASKLGSTGHGPDDGADEAPEQPQDQ